ncbi:hypothetical protein TRFO_20617 [Tritrichomonas foetus]|uniref:Importin N-terminal domain-containing protein n=1 Tax=Tritrichomonas foetus TaxID=1144522 RepID=A0A1J4KKE4_9EUKA|nr:hypothetical protein TRFO_20617 [Tritrichomonas foetus]|eukprot:OHT10158.1 hypothetical protein TRFO_20617 [Tritrichomonas foetus]
MESPAILNSIIQAILSGQNEAIHQAETIYLSHLIQNTEVFIIDHLNAISSATSEVVKRSVLVLLGNAFTLMAQNNLVLQDESSNHIQSSLLCLFQIQNLTQYHFEIISNILFKAAQYFKDKWIQLPNSLLEIIHSNQNELNDLNNLICSSAVEVFNQCISNSIINPFPYLESLFNLIHHSFVSLNPKISSYLRLLYSIILTDDYFQHTLNFIPLFELIPSLLHLSQSDPRIMYDLYIFSNCRIIVFMNYYQLYCQKILEILSNEFFSIGVKNTSIDIIITFFSNFSGQLVSQAFPLFDLFVNLLPQNDYCIMALTKLSKIYGGNIHFALHIYNFFDRNPGNPYSYYVFGSCFEGCKDHFLINDFASEIFDHFSPGLTSQDDFTRLYAFRYFCPILTIFAKYINDYSPETVISTTLNILQNENNIEILYEEVNLLNRLLKYYGENFQEILPSVVQILDKLLIMFSNPLYKKKIISCYKYIANSFKESFAPFCQHIVTYLLENIRNQLSDREMFFYCLKVFPCFSDSFPKNLFFELINFSFSFIFSLNIEEDITKDERYYIVEFLLKCNEYIDTTPDIFSKVIPFALNVASYEPNFEEIESNYDPSLYQDCLIFTKSGKIFCVSIFQILEIKKSLVLINVLFRRNPHICASQIPLLYEFTQKQLQSRIAENILYEIYDLEETFISFIPTFEEFFALLKSNFAFITKESFNNHIKLSKLLIIMCQNAGDKWKNLQDEKINSFVEYFINHTLIMLHLNNQILQTEKFKTDQIEDNTFDEQFYNKINIYCCLMIREVFKNFPSASNSLFPKIFELVKALQSQQDTNTIISSLIFSDYIKYCPQSDPTFIGIALETFQQGLQHELSSVKCNSIYGIAMILMPNYINGEMTCSIVNSIINSPLKENQYTRIFILFLLLRVFQNYMEIFDVSQFLPIFFELLPSKINLPKYSYEYFAESMIFFMNTFGNRIPEEKKKIMFTIIQILSSSKVLPKPIKETIEVIHNAISHHYAE